MNDVARAIEERMLNAWPALETRIAGDWLLRFANGYSKRANSATTLTPGADMDDAMIARHIAQAEAWTIAPVVRVTPLCAAGLDARLAARGFEDIEPTFGMIGDISRDIAVDPRATFASSPDAQWISANATAYGGVKSNAAHLKAILERIRPAAAFAILTEGHTSIAWGIGVVERGFVGLQDLVVAPHMRGRGVGRALVGSLLAWGKKNGASRAYLHVAGHNAPARALYRSLGFMDAYELRHRVLTRK